MKKTPQPSDAIDARTNQSNGKKTAADRIVEFPDHTLEDRNGVLFISFTKPSRPKRRDRKDIPPQFFSRLVCIGELVLLKPFLQLFTRSRPCPAARRDMCSPLNLVPISCGAVSEELYNPDDEDRDIFWLQRCFATTDHKA
eukprot:COSAG01_NODE_7480_length_3192_cov_44.800194_2_plen_141_part_00